MAEDELLRKIDRTLERNTDAFERNTDAFERTITTLDRVNQRLDRADERDRELREFLDALTERHIGVTQQLIERMVAGFARLETAIEDQRAQIQANTEAVLRVLDRLGPSPQQG